eukprot:TRINITY_DN31197_c0_g1_i1.p1 TRINITY_DN31197_c0_g1~~TRINITY_DN31197_c0_g1_i1.p1  ORF type:complete len:422 (-),score=65.00 TRINITY_DN31197_c0_g1_i1:72-1337(-)
MGKHDFLTPKAIANRIKAKGLQKLRWYCQLCQKQCRDENGFQCHIKSESHRRQMEIFGQNSGRIVHGYSEEFEQDFMTLLRRGHPFSRVRANTVYNEYIQDRNHIHMNSTRWYTLTGFVQYLGKTGKCIVDQDEEGVWWIKLNQEDPFETLSKGKKRNREEKEGEDEVRSQKRLEKQIQKAAKLNKIEEVDEDQEADERDESLDKHLEPIQLVLGSSNERKPSDIGQRQVKNQGQDLSGDDINEVEDTIKSEVMLSFKNKKKESALDRIMKNDQYSQQQKLQQQHKTQSSSQGQGQGQIYGSVNDEQPWLFEGIVVKIKSQALQKNGYFGKKGIVKKIIDKFVGELEVIDDGMRVRVDQQELETVIPGYGGKVLVVGGNLKGKMGVLVSIKEELFKAEVEVEQDSQATRLFDYEHICKFLE